MCKRRIVDLSTNSGRPANTAVTDSNGFLLEWGGVGKFFLGESQSRLYPHMRAKFWRSPTAVSKKVSFKLRNSHQCLCLLCGNAAGYNIITIDMSLISN